MYEIQFQALASLGESDDKSQGKKKTCLIGILVKNMSEVKLGVNEGVAIESIIDNNPNENSQKEDSR